MSTTAAALPLTPGGKGLPEGGLAILRPVLGGYMRRRWDINVRGDAHVPEQGPVILASNHIGWLDGPLLVATAPRPAHALVKSEMFEGPTKLLMKVAGQIKVKRFATDAGAVRRAVRALRADQVVVVYPEGTRGDGEFVDIKGGAAYLALVTGAPVVPVAVFGTRNAGDGSSAKPAKGARIDIVYGAPIQLDPVEWPRDKPSVAEANTLIHEHLLAHLADAKTKTRLELPGKLPAGDKDA